MKLLVNMKLINKNMFFKITYNNLKGPQIVLHHGWLEVIHFTQTF